MIRVNGTASAAVFMNMYPDRSSGANVLYLHISAPDSEAVLWDMDGQLTIEADWREEMGGVRYAAKQGLAHVLDRCSVQGKFHSYVEDLIGDGRIVVNLRSIGTVSPWDRVKLIPSLTDSPQTSHSLPRGG